MSQGLCLIGMDSVGNLGMVSSQFLGVILLLR
uniref:Uncharacterized protein n=1 Tax=Arundo donax TaxID=35708 RepID=A0A0A9EQ95_ARUDO